MNEDDADREVAELFRRRLHRAAQEAPPFATMLASAEDQVGAGRWRRPVVAIALPIAAVLAVALVWWPEADRAPPAQPTALLMAELTATTRWRAPSDRWLAGRPRPAYLGMPRLNVEPKPLDPQS